MQSWIRDSGYYVGWRFRWVYNVKMAHDKPEEREGYSRAAVLAQAMYVIHRALWLGKYGVKPK